MSKEELLRKVKDIKFKRVRSGMIKIALQTGACDRGNHAVTVNDEAMIFYYRGVKIAYALFKTLEMHVIYAENYERTAATSNQRKMIKEALKEIKNAVGKEAEVSDNNTRCCKY